MKIFIQIPCFNEEKQIENTIKEIKNSIDTKKYDYKIIVIDDGSNDQTIEKAKKVVLKKLFL